MGAHNTKLHISIPLTYVSEESDDYDLPQKKIFVLGDNDVGKSSIIFRFIYDKFNFHYIPTAGCHFESKISNFHDEITKICIWDVSGAQRYRTVITEYMLYSDVVLIVYDKTNIKSFEHINYWLDIVRSVLQNPQIILVGNKSDAVHKIQVSTKMGKKFAFTHGLYFTETSASNGMGIQELFNGSCLKRTLR